MNNDDDFFPVINGIGTTRLLLAKPKADEWVAGSDVPMAVWKSTGYQAMEGFIEVDTRDLPLEVDLRILRFDEGHSVPRQESEDFVVKVRLKL